GNLVNPRPHRVSTSLNVYKQCKAGRGALTPLHSQVQPEAGPSRAIPQVVTTSDLESDKEKPYVSRTKQSDFPAHSARSVRAGTSRGRRRALCARPQGARRAHAGHSDRPRGTKAVASQLRKGFPDLKYRSDLQIADGDFVPSYRPVTGTHK